MGGSLGIHIILDLYDIENIDSFKYVEDVKNLFNYLVNMANLHKISSHYHQFKPYGVTGIILLEESHISIHTWPENNYISIDIYTCGDKTKALKVKDYLINNLKPKKYKENIIFRGYEFIYKK